MKYLVLLIYTILFVPNLEAQPQKIINKIYESMDTLNTQQSIHAHIDIATQFLFFPNSYDSTEWHALKALEMSEQTDNTLGKQRAHYYLGTVAWNRDEDYPEALKHFKLTKSYISEIGNTDKLGTIDNAIGLVYLLMGDYENAISTLQIAYQEAINEKDYALLSNICTNIANIHSRMSDSEKSIASYKEAVQLLYKDNSKERDYHLVTCSLNLSEAYRSTEKLDSAEWAADIARRVLDTLDYERGRNRLLVIELNLLDIQKKYDELFKLAKSNLLKMEQVGGYDRSIYATILYYYTSGLIRQKKSNKAKYYINELKSLLPNLNPGHKKDVLSRIYLLNKELGHYEEALSYFEEFKVLSDTLFNEEKNNRILQLESLYELEKKEKLITQKEKDNLKLVKKNSKLISIILGLLLLLTLYYFIISKKRQNEKEEVNRIEQKLLSLQMNPHFIFNAISSIQNFLFDEGDSKKAITYLATFANLMRQMLENSRERFIPLEDEILFLNNYLKLQKLRFANKFDYEINIDSDIDISAVGIPPLLMQPFIENTIEHGKIYLVKGGLVSVNINKDAENLKITILDNGIGMDDKNKSDGLSKTLVIKKKSLSISITNKRLDLLSKLLKKSYNLKIAPNQDGRGVIVNLHLPTISI